MENTLTPPKIKKEKQANLELLRIIAMLMIITLHFLSHGGVLKSLTAYSPAYIIAWVVEAIALVSVNCYVLISGYFLCESKFRLKKLLILLGEVFFYSAIIYIIFVAAGKESFSVMGARSAFLPTTTREYWFVSMYVGLYIFSPFLNIFIRSASKAEHMAVIVVMSICFSLIACFVKTSEWIEYGGGMGLVWFAVLYITAAYIKKYYSPKKRDIKKFVLWFCVADVLLPISKIALTYIAQKFLSGALSQADSGKLTNALYQYNSLPVFAASILLFLIFINISINKGFIKNIILFAAPLTFGVYLIHDNSLIRTELWQFVNPVKYINTPFIWVYMIITVAAIFIACAVVEFIRSLIFKRINNSQWLNTFCGKAENKIKSTIKKHTKQKG